MPRNVLLKLPYAFYLKVIIPIVGRLFQGNSRDYKMLGVYTSAFGDSQDFSAMLQEAGLESNYEKLFFGCATLCWGTKPYTPSPSSGSSS